MGESNRNLKTTDNVIGFHFYYFLTPVNEENLRAEIARLRRQLAERVRQSVEKDKLNSELVKRIEKLEKKIRNWQRKIKSCAGSSAIS
ncbi:MAG: hypothetical protein QXT45_07555 [Candidatus Bilamarchaeaceae archaeon]